MHVGQSEFETMRGIGPELIMMYGDDVELMGKPFFQRRRKCKQTELLGRSFLRRRISGASKLIRPLGHQVLNIAAKVPLTAGFVKAGRVADKYALDALKSKLSRGFTSKKSGAKTPEDSTGTTATETETGRKPISKTVIIAGGATLLVLGLGGIFLATREKKKG